MFYPITAMVTNDNGKSYITTINSADEIGLQIFNAKAVRGETIQFLFNGDGDKVDKADLMEEFILHADWHIDRLVSSKPAKESPSKEALAEEIPFL